MHQERDKAGQRGDLKCGPAPFYAGDPAFSAGKKTGVHGNGLGRQDIIDGIADEKGPVRGYPEPFKGQDQAFRRGFDTGDLISG